MDSILLTLSYPQVKYAKPWPAANSVSRYLAISRKIDRWLECAIVFQFVWCAYCDNANKVNKNTRLVSSRESECVLMKADSKAKASYS